MTPFLRFVPAAVVLCAAAFSAQAQVRATLLGDVGTPAQAQRTVDITPATKWVNVTQGDVVRFNSGDRSFVWNFDGAQISSFKLNRVAPAGFLDRPLTVYVAPNENYYD